MSLEKALKAFDRDLVLNAEFDPTYQMAVYDVHKRLGGDRPAAFICSWRDERGMPLPLSSGLLELVRKLRGHGDNADVANQRLVDDQEREAFDAAYEAARDMLPRIAGKKLSPLHRGIHLRRARARNGRYDR